MRISARSLVLVLLAVIALAACNPVKTMQDRDRMTRLESVVNTYRKLMRWGHYDQAAQYIKARDGSHTLPDFKDLNRYKVTSFTIADQIIADTRFDAKVTAYVEFYDTDSGVVASLRDDQFWWYDQEKKHWYLGSPMINFVDFVR